MVDEASALTILPSRLFMFISFRAGKRMSISVDCAVVVPATVGTSKATAATIKRRVIRPGHGRNDRECFRLLYARWGQPIL